jgi:hypothetical protein
MTDSKTLPLTGKILEKLPDPLRIRETTRRIVRHASLVRINFNQVKRVTKLVKRKIRKKEILTAEQFGSDNPTPQLIFVLDAINFCFWAKKGDEKWTVEYPKGNFIANGWFALVTSIERARQEGIPILEADYLKNMRLSEAKYIFRSANHQSIPLLKKRVENLNLVGKILAEKYEGNIYNFLGQTGLNAGKIAAELVKEFPCFEDYAIFDRQRVNFYKRAQIFAYDLSLLPDLKITNLESLTLFADYKVPQILRALGVLEYAPKLAKKIDDYQILKEGSREEVEIRSATIWAGELIAQQAGTIPVEVDNVLWKASQSIRDIKPYHRVLTTAY